MNALIVTAKGLSIVLHAMGREGGLRGFISGSVKNAMEREGALVRFEAGQASFKHRHNEPDPLGRTR